MRLALYAFSICLLGLVLGANVPDIGLDDMPLRAGLSNEIISRSASAEIDTFTWVFVTDPDLVYETADPPTNGDEPASTGYAAAIAGADSVVDLSAISGVANADLDKAVPNEYDAMSGSAIRVSALPNDVWSVDDTDPDQELILFRVPWENVLPTNCTILNASLHLVVAVSDFYASEEDSFVVTLMTKESDSDWWAASNLGSSDDSFAANASWNWQTTTGAATGTDAWTPALDDRSEWIDWGDVSDMSSGSLNGAYIEANSHHPVKIRNCVQAAVDGATNNGMLLSYLESFTGRIEGRITPLNSQTSRPPWFSVTFSTQHYSPPFNGKEWAFVFSTDDGNAAANDTFVACYSGYPGAKYSANVHWGGLGSNYTAANVATWDASPFVEVGLHARTSIAAAGGVTQWGASGAIPAGVPASGDAAWDSLIIDTSPDWLVNTMISYDGVDRSSSPYFAKVFAFPGQNFDPEALLALDYHGLSGWRCDAVSVIADPESGERLIGDVANTATADTAWGGIVRPRFPQTPRNLDLVPVTIQMSSIVGDTAALADTAAVRLDVKRKARSLLAQDRRLFSTYTHDLKFGASGSTGNYGGGAEGVELRVILDQVENMGGAMMCVGDYVAALKGRALAVATPDTFGQDFKWTASQRRFFVPLFPGRR